ncbi:hypothetical protein Vadar_030902 [Vaccinium darrowii]|uniref:Uncharacterized protein n=1 Tax=Vaccinium darrowii TaxID=229202 RepID=A0ACB7ZNH8_9ERIC|nr:hypothetical protein Vadar_030902 [Vaccinium darrowii]
MDCDACPLEEDPNLENVGKPKLGMSFDSEHEARNYYASFARVREFEVREDIQVGESGYLKTVSFHVHFDEVSKESNCTRRLFKHKGIVCKHIIVLCIEEKLDSIPDKYILRRWRKDVTRSHTKGKVSYSNWEMKPEWRRYDIMKVAFDAATHKAVYSEAKIERVVVKLREVEAENDVCDDECLVPPISIDVQDSIVFVTWEGIVAATDASAFCN